MLFEDIGRSEDYYYKNYYKRNIEKRMLGKVPDRDENNKDKSEYEKDIANLEHMPICDPKNRFLYEDYIGEFREIDYSLEHKEWRKQYYKYYFGFDVTKSNSRSKLVEVVHEYLKAILYVQFYYFIECPSWSWYYKYRVSPLPQDIGDVMGKEIKDINKIVFTKGEPYTPIQQLMFVMPTNMVDILQNQKNLRVNGK